MSISKPNTLYWIIAIIALLWNLSGLGAFIYDTFLMTEEVLISLPQIQQDLIAQAPAWGAIVYGVATISGFLASVLMLMRIKFQTPLFLISLIAVIVQIGYNWIVLKTVSKLDMTSGIIFPAIVVVLAIVFYGYSNGILKKAWLR